MNFIMNFKKLKKYLKIINAIQCTVKIFIKLNFKY